MSTRYKATAIETVSGTWAGCGADHLGRRLVLADTSVNDMSLWLPSAALNRHAKIAKTSALHTLTIRASAQAPIWSSTSATYAITNIDSVDFYSDGTNWYTLNPTVIIR